MAKPKYGNKQKVKGGVLKRSRRRAKSLGREGVLKGGVTGREARSLKQDYTRDRGGAGGGVESRARDRLKQIGSVGGVNPKDGISRPEARKVRKAWQTERRHDPLRPRSGRDILSEAEALTDLQYGPEERELASERRYSQGRANVMGNWMDAYKAEVQQIAQQNQIAQQAFQQGAYAAAQQGFQADTAGVASRQAQSASQSAQLGGPAPDPSVAMQAQQAAGGRLAQGNAFGNALGQMGAAQTGLFNQRAIGAGQQRMEVLADEHARASTIDRLARELAGERGTFKTKAIGELKDSERQYALERSAFNLDVAETKNDIAGDAAERNQERGKKKRAKRARRKLNSMPDPSKIKGSKRQRWDRIIDIADDGERNQSRDFQDYAKGIKGDSFDDKPSTTSGGKDTDGDGSPDFTPHQVRGNRSTFENKVAASRDPRGRGKSYEWHYGALIDANVDALMAKVIAAKATKKRVSANLLRRFEQRYGFRPSAKGRGRPQSPLDRPDNAPGPRGQGQRPT